MYLGGICTGVWVVWCLKVLSPYFHGSCIRVTLTTHCSTIGRDHMFGNALYQLCVIHFSFFWRFVAHNKSLMLSYPCPLLVDGFSTVAMDIWCSLPVAHEHHSTTVAMVQVRMLSTSCTTKRSQFLSGTWSGF